MKVAVVGGGVTGLAAAHQLARSGGARVTLYEKEDHLAGGYARTVDVDDGSAGSVHLDLSLMVFNRVRTYIYNIYGLYKVTNSIVLKLRLRLRVLYLSIRPLNKEKKNSSILQVVLLYTHYY